MTSSGRLGLTTRAFFLATLLGLALAFQENRVLQGTLLLLFIAALAVAAGRLTIVGDWWVCLVEGVLAALVIGAGLPDTVMLLPYLMVPALLAGVASGAAAVTLVSGGQVVALVLVLSAAGPSASTAIDLELAVPWIVASLGAGFVGASIGQLRGSSVHQDDASYESARRLLSQLRTVARRLSSGLDPISMATQILSTTHATLQDHQSAVFVRTEGGILAPLGYRGSLAKESLLAEGHLVDRCWAEMEPAHAPQPSGLSAQRHRAVLPLRSGSRMIGVVISEGPAAPAQSDIDALMHDLDEQALRLDTALVFDEVRSLATMEERQRLAREIHDGVAQEVASLGYVVDELAATAASDAQRVQLQGLRSEISRVVSELRLSIFDLRSEISPAAGLGSALSDYVRAVGARSGLTVHLTLDEGPTRLRGEVETELLRIAQEAVTNARKHSDAANLWVDCRVRPPYAQITVQDDGGGLGQARPDSYGLKIMRERAERVGATLEVGEASAHSGVRGTRVAVTVGADAAGNVNPRMGSEEAR